MTQMKEILAKARSLIRLWWDILTRRPPSPEQKPSSPGDEQVPQSSLPKSEDLVKYTVVTILPEAARPAPTAWRVLGASVQGSRHERLGIPCQDACEWKSTTDGTLVIAVADGAGSATHSHVGAQTAVRVVIEHLADFDRLQKIDSEKSWYALATETLEKAVGAIKIQARSYDLAMREFATTLSFVVLRQHWIAAFQIGDGAIVVRDSDKQLHTLTYPVSGEYVNETVFVTSMSAVDSARVVFRESSVSHLCIFTDGIQMLALQMPTASPHAPFFESLFGFLDSLDASAERLESFLRSCKVRERTDDDITIVLASRCGYEG